MNTKTRRKQRCPDESQFRHRTARQRPTQARVVVTSMLPCTAFRYTDEREGWTSPASLWSLRFDPIETLSLLGRCRLEFSPPGALACFPSYF
jgi:hypothetical protein